MNIKFKAFMFGLAMAVLAMPAQAGIVTFTADLSAPTSIVGTVNNGGLSDGTGGRVIANGAADLVLPVTIDDSAGTGAIFDGLLTLTGSRGSGGTAEVQVIGNGSVFFSGGGTRILTFDFSGLTETTATGASIAFDGITSALITGPNEASAGSIGGVDFDPVPAGVTTVAPQSTGPLQAVVDRDGGAFSLSEVGFQFTVTLPDAPAVPEPSSLALLGVLGSLAVVRRRRK